MPGAHRVFPSRRLSLSRQPGVVGGTNSGAQAVNLAYHLGATRIVLLGFDMKHTGGKRHFHDDYPSGWSNAETANSWPAQFAFMAAGLASEGIEVLNASRDTAITCVPRVSLQCALT